MAAALKKLNSEWDSRMKKAQEELESRLRKAVEDAKVKEAEAFQRIIDRNNAQSAKQLEELQARLAESEAQKTKLETYVTDLQNQTKKLNLLVSEWEKKYRKLSEEFQNLENDRSATGLQAEKLGSELTGTQAELQKLRDQIRTKDRTIATMAKEYEEMLASFRKEIGSLSANASDKETYLRTELENKSQRIEGLQHEVYLLNKNVRQYAA
jgi:chromosome segregation ATPase